MKRNLFLLLVLCSACYQASSQAVTDVSSRLAWKRITNHKGEEFHPSFSPDGKYIVFDSQDSAKLYHVMLFNMNIPEQEPVEISIGDHPFFYRDSRQILFPSSSNGKVETFRINIDGSERTQLTRGGGFPISVSPDGNSIVYLVKATNHWNIGIIDVNGRNQRMLTKHNSNDFSPTWSNDSQRIMFTTEKNDNTDVMIMNVKDPKPVRLLSTIRNTSSAKWSPDGRTILFVSNESGGDEIYTASNDGKNTRRLTNLPGVKYWVSFTPDGKQIYFICNNDSEAEIFIMDVDGHNLIRLTNNNTREAAPSISPDGSKMVFVSTVDNDLEIFYTDITVLR